MEEILNKSEESLTVKIKETANGVTLKFSQSEEGLKEWLKEQQDKGEN